MGTQSKHADRAQMAINRAKKVWGSGWTHLSEYQRQAAIAFEIVQTIKAQDESLTGYSQAQKLIDEAGL